MRPGSLLQVTRRPPARASTWWRCRRSAFPVIRRSASPLWSPAGSSASSRGSIRTLFTSRLRSFWVGRWCARPPRWASRWSRSTRPTLPALRCGTGSPPLRMSPGDESAQFTSAPTSPWRPPLRQPVSLSGTAYLVFRYGRGASIPRPSRPHTEMSTSGLDWPPRARSWSALSAGWPPRSKLRTWPCWATCPAFGLSSSVTGRSVSD